MYSHAPPQRSVQLHVRRHDGWEIVSFRDIDQLWTAGAPGEDSELTFTLIGKRNDDANQIETQILDVAKRHRSLIDSTFPVDEKTGEAAPVALRTRE